MDDMMVQIKRQIHSAVDASGEGNLHGLIGGMTTSGGAPLGAMSKTPITQTLPITSGNGNTVSNSDTTVNFSLNYTNVVQFVRNYATLADWVAFDSSMADPHPEAEAEP